ncbi:hypothetical protein POTOM_054595 [Populus tomentosa]|uniref:Uncharacterized protein n=1 Tax=Populus tomentosa TaxID=118781 RepID=A0A8X7XZI3_POPTO|nr:hypothetical protein POTOM_054595 [Populus tomentosa]
MKSMVPPRYFPIVLRIKRLSKKSQGSAPLPELPKAQTVASGPTASELKAKLEAEQHALRRMRMCLRDLGTVTRTSARLRNVQPDVNLDQSYEALKRQKKNADATHAGVFNGNAIYFVLMILLFVFPTYVNDVLKHVKLQDTFYVLNFGADTDIAASAAEDKSRHQDSVQEKPPEEAGADDMNPDRPESSSADDSRHETSEEEKLLVIPKGVDPKMLQCQKPKLYTRTMKGVLETKNKGVEDDGPRYSILRFLVKFAENTANF